MLGFQTMGDWYHTYENGQRAHLVDNDSFVIHSERQSGITTFGDNMAENKQDFIFTGTNIEKQWLHKSVTLQRENLTRSLNKEMAGSEIHTLRKREIEQLNQLLNKLS